MTSRKLDREWHWILLSFTLQGLQGAQRPSSEKASELLGCSPNAAGIKWSTLKKIIDEAAQFYKEEENRETGVVVKKEKEDGGELVGGNASDKKKVKAKAKTTGKVKKPIETTHNKKRKAIPLGGSADSESRKGHLEKKMDRSDNIVGMTGTSEGDIRGSNGPKLNNIDKP